MKTILALLIVISFSLSVYGQEIYGVDVSDTVTPVQEWKQLFTTGKFVKEFSGEAVDKVTFNSNDNSFLFVSNHPKNNVFNSILNHVKDKFGKPTTYVFNYPDWLNDNDELLDVYIEAEGGSKSAIWELTDMTIHMLWEGETIILSLKRS